jgi:hypothetical protein
MNYRYQAREEPGICAGHASLERLRLKRETKKRTLSVPMLSMTNMGLNLTENDISMK